MGLFYKKLKIIPGICRMWVEQIITDAAAWGQAALPIFDAASDAPAVSLRSGSTEKRPEAIIAPGLNIPLPPKSFLLTICGHVEPECRGQACEAILQSQSALRLEAPDPD